MSTETTTDHDTDKPIGMAPVQAVDEGNLTPELIERVGKLSRGGLIKLSEFIDNTLGDGEFAVARPSREEIQRRLNSILDGTSESYSIEETMAYLRSRVWREGQS